MIRPETADFLEDIALASDPVAQFERALGIAPRPFQVELLTCTSTRVIVMASRQIGKSSALAFVAWRDFMKGLTVVVVCPTEKQSKEFLIRVQQFKDAEPYAPVGLQFLKMEVSAPRHSGRILAMPATENIRGLSADTLIVDEAALLDDEQMAAALPIRTKADHGKLFVSSTPMFRSGFFYNRWTEANEYKKIRGHYREQAPELVERIESERQDYSPNRFAREYDLVFAGSSESVIGMDVLERAINPQKKALMF